MVYKNILHYRSTTNRMCSINVEVERKRRKDNFFFLSLDRKRRSNCIRCLSIEREREKERIDKKMLRVNE
jgi:hypothetical protein